LPHPVQCLNINWKGHTVRDLNIIVKSEGLLKVTGSQVQWKSGNILETVLDRDVVTTDNNQLTTGSDSHIWPIK